MDRKRCRRLLIFTVAAIAVITVLAVVMSGCGPAEPPGTKTPRTAAGRKKPPAKRRELPERPRRTERAEPRPEVPIFKARDEFRKALNFDRQHPDGDHARRMEMYAAVFESYPDSKFAAHAREKHNKIKAVVQKAANGAIAAAGREKFFDAKIGRLQEFLEKFPDTQPVELIRQEIERAREKLTRKFESDMNRVTALAESERFDEAQRVLDSVMKYATDELKEKAAEKKRLVAGLRERAQKKKAVGVRERAYVDLARAILPHMADFRFEKARSVCNSRLGSASSGEVRQIIAAEKRDISLLLEVQKRFRENLSRIAGDGTTVEMECRDGAKLKGAIEDAGGSFIMNRRYVIDMRKLSTAQIMELAGSDSESRYLKEEMLLLACAGDIAQAQRSLQEAHERGLLGKEVSWYEMKLKVLTELSATGARPEPAAELVARKERKDTARLEEKPEEVGEPDTRKERKVAPKKKKKPGVAEKIFNGRNIKGFKADQKVFKVDKKHIYAVHTRRGVPAHLVWKQEVEGDFTFSVKFLIEAKRGRNTSMGGGVAPVGAGIVFGHDESKADFYRFWTDAVFGEKGWVGLSGGRFGSCTSRSAGRGWIEAKVEIRNNRLKTYFNGEEINSEDIRYKGGKVGVFVHLCNARFKDLELCREPEKPAGKEKKGPAEKTLEPAVKEAKGHPREDPVAKRVLDKLKQISPKGYVAVPAGEFLMGAEIEPGVPPDTVPQHKVYVDAFFIRRYEVKQKRYKMFINETGTAPPGEKDRSTSLDWRNGTYPPGMERHPVVRVTWAECDAYCKWMSRKTGRTYRLPTEAEWEKAASWNFVKKEKYKYPWGNKPPEPGWFPEPPRGGGGFPVGSNPHDISFCGCHDMLGNVNEFCLDVYDAGYYRRSAPRNPVGPRWPPRPNDRHTVRGTFIHALTGRYNGGDAQSWRPTYVTLRAVIVPTETEKFLMEKILQTKGEFDVQAYLEKQRKEKLANYEKHLFKGSASRKGDTLKISYNFKQSNQLQDWRFAHNITRPHERSADSGMWDIMEGQRKLSGGGRIAAFAEASFTGDATFDVHLKMRNAKNLTLIVACPGEEKACAACFAIGPDNAPFVDDAVKARLTSGYRNLIFQLEEGSFEQFMMSCSEKELTLKDGRVKCSGTLVVSGTLDSSAMDTLSARNLDIGAGPITAAAKKKLKPNKSYRFSVRVKEGFVLFYLGREFLGFTTAPGESFKFGIAAYNSFVDVTKVEIAGKPDPEWIKRQLKE